MTPYDKLMARKRKWTPVKPVAGQCKEGAEETIYRALALRHMELPVGDFITDALASEVPESPERYSSQMYGMKRTTTWHLVTSPMLTALMKRLKAEALALREAWTSHPDHTVLKAMVAERAIFFVLLPFFRFNGDAAMRTTSADISRDEQIHVATNSLVCSELGLNISPSLDKLRKATINWVMQPLQAGNPDKFLDKKFWLDSSDRLMYEGKAPELSATRSARMPAFFEHSNVNLPQYA